MRLKRVSICGAPDARRQHARAERSAADGGCAAY